MQATLFVAAMLRYRADVLAEQQAPVEEYFRAGREAEVQKEAEQAAIEALNASKAAEAIKAYVSWPPKQRPFDGTPKRPVPGVYIPVGCVCCCVPANRYVPELIFNMVVAFDVSRGAAPLL